MRPSNRQDLLDYPDPQRDPELTRFVQRLPKAELHLHLEGCAPWHLVQEMNPQPFANTPPFWRPDFRYPDFTAFLEALKVYCAEVFTSLDGYARTTRAILETCADQNARHVELSFNFLFIPRMGFDGRELCRTIRAQAPEGLDLRLLIGFNRNDYRPEVADQIEALLHYDEVDGFDLHGPEDLPLEDWTIDYWNRAREAGKTVRAHAGEFQGAAHVLEVVEKLGVRRIEHGVRAVEDPEVLRALAERGVTCDVCPISNLKLQAGGLQDLREHPLPRMMAAGVLCTLNTDDTFAFGNSLIEDYLAAVQCIGLSRSELAQLTINAWNIADVSPQMREAAVQEILQIEVEEGESRQ